MQLYLKMTWQDAIMLAKDLEMYIPTVRESIELNLPYTFWTNTTDSFGVAYNSKKERTETNELLNVVLVNGLNK